MKSLLAISFLVVCFCSILFSQSQTVTATYKYVLGDNDSRNDAKRLAFIEAKRLCIEKVGTYVQSSFKRQLSEAVIDGKSKLSDVTYQELMGYINAFVKVEVVSEVFAVEGTSNVLTTTVKAQVDQKSLVAKFGEVAGDDDLRERVLKQQKELEKLQSTVSVLQIQLAKASDERAIAIRQERAFALQDMDALEEIRFTIRKATAIASEKVELLMTMEEVRRVAGLPRAGDNVNVNSVECWNYGNVYVIFHEDLVVAVIKASDYTDCGRIATNLSYYRSRSIKK
jgi:hypothetical protein